MKTTRRVLIAGCGDVGTALGAALSNAGQRVFGLRRRAHDLPPPIAPIPADLLDPASLRALPDDLDAVVYAAAPGARDEAAYRAVYDLGVRNLLDAIDRRDAVSRVLLISSTSVYGQRKGEWVDESSETSGQGLARHLLAGERRVRAFSPRAVILRCSGIYGPGRERLLARVKAGARYGEPSPFTNRIHRDDVARAAAHVLRMEDPPALLLASDCEPARERDVLRFVAGLVGAPEPVSSGAPDARGEGRRVSSEMLRKTGFAFRYSTYREGYSALYGGSGAGSGSRGAIT